MKKTLVACSFALALSLATQASQAALVVDQQQTAQTVEGVAMLPSWTSIGQSFIPTLDSIDWAEFMLRAETSTPVTVRLSILDGVSGNNGLGGAVLGMSDPETVLFSDTLGTVTFDFGTPIALTPGNTYVLQVNLLSGGVLKFGSTFNSPYTDGRMFQSPYPTTIMQAEDFYFREGVTAAVNGVPEPSGLVLAGLALAGLAAVRRRQG
jgi:hypothetical protein